MIILIRESFGRNMLVGSVAVDALMVMSGCGGGINGIAGGINGRRSIHFN